jgi:ribonucleoside-triphosphate reductase
MRVYKRNGEIENFDKNKIITAINKAFIEVDGVLYETETAEDIADAIERFVGLNQYPVPIEKIQDRIENYLMRSERLDVARAYIRYRYKREVVRGYTDDMLKEISNKLKAKNVQNQNANVDEQSFGGRMGEAGGVVWKKYALDQCVSQMARENHINNEIYIHDLDSYAVGMHNCLTIPFDKLLAEGFNTRQTDVRPAGSVNTAFQLVAVIFQLESLQQFGGVSASHIDWTMVPYVRKSFVKHYKKGLKFIENIEVDEKM